MASEEVRRQQYKLDAARGDVRHLSNQLSRMTPGTKRYTDKLDELAKARQILLEQSNRYNEMIK